MKIWGLLVKGLQSYWPSKFENVVSSILRVVLPSQKDLIFIGLFSDRSEIKFA